jgi:GGDEF domain-containing protein
VCHAVEAELAHTDPDLLADAAERLSLVTGLLLGAVLRRREAAESATRGAPPVTPLRVAWSESDPRSGPSGARPDAGDHEHDATRGVTPGFVDTARPPGMVAGDAGRERSAGGGAEADEGEGTGLRLAREDDRDALWVGALRDEIVRAGRASLPLSLLLIELDDAERLVAVEPDTEASATFGRFAQAVRTSVRRRDVLACETDSRSWIIARETGRAGAHALGTRIAAGVPAEEKWRGAPLTVSVGLAVLGEDGFNAAALISAAEQTRFAAEASGIGIVSDDEIGDIEPPEAGPSLVS